MVRTKLSADHVRRLLNEQFAEHFYFEQLCELPTGSVRRALLGSGDRRTEDVICEMLDLPRDAIFPVARLTTLDATCARFGIANTEVPSGNGTATVAPISPLARLLVLVSSLSRQIDRANPARRLMMALVEIEEAARTRAEALCDTACQRTPLSLQQRLLLWLTGVRETEAEAIVWSDPDAASPSTPPEASSDHAPEASQPLQNQTYSPTHQPTTRRSTGSPSETAGCPSVHLPSADRSTHERCLAMLDSSDRDSSSALPSSEPASAASFNGFVNRVRAAARIIIRGTL